MKFADASRARIAAVTANCSDCRAAASLGYLKKNGAVDKIHLPRAFFETESRVGAEAGDGLVVESQFDPRLPASANSGAMADTSLSATGRGAGFSSSTLTSFTTWVTRAARNCTPRAEVAMAIVQIKADAAAMNFVCGEPANRFFIPAGILVHKKQHRCRHWLN